MPSTPQGIQPHADFVAELHALDRPKSRAFRARPDVAAGTAELRQMQEYLLGFHDGNEPVHSFEDEGGSVFDCVPIERQPALRRSGQTADKPSDAPGATDPAAGGAVGQFRPGAHDSHGNSMKAPAGTVPVRRTTLDDLAAYASLDLFFKKNPGSRGSAVGADAVAPGPGPLRVTGAPEEVHAYGVARVVVGNKGGHACMNINEVAIDEAKGQQFSLTQLWVVGTKDAQGQITAQTIEPVLDNFPKYWRHKHVAAVIAFTADAYATFYRNLDGGHFIQTNSNWALGGSLLPGSTVNGTQAFLEVAVYLSNGKWWLFFGGTAAANAVGYYPATTFGAGPLATGAQRIDFGGEVCFQQSAVPGVTLPLSFSPMGTGGAASGGFRKAAYQRDLRYYPPSGGASHIPTVVDIAAGEAYNFSAALNSYAAPWNRTLWFGGPGTG